MIDIDGDGNLTQTEFLRVGDGWRWKLNVWMGRVASRTTCWWRSLPRLSPQVNPQLLTRLPITSPAQWHSSSLHSCSPNVCLYLVFSKSSTEIGHHSTNFLGQVPWQIENFFLSHSEWVAPSMLLMSLQDWLTRVCKISLTALKDPSIVILLLGHLDPPPHSGPGCGQTNLSKCVKCAAKWNIFTLDIASN